MAFIDDAKYSGRPLHAPTRPPRYVYSWAALGATLLLWAIMIVTVARQL